MTVFAPGSVSMRIYPHNELDAPEVVDEFRRQARLAVESGFDGVMNSEHHGGFHGYSPNPIQIAGWMLEAMPRGWAAPCPMVLPIRPVALVAEEVAWLAARFPGRVGIGVAPGGLPLDFEVMDLEFAEAMPRFRAGLPRLVAMLRGDQLGAGAGDRALEHCRSAPVTVISTAMSPPAVRRAARVGAGIVFDGATVPQYLGELAGEYRNAGGDQPVVLIRRAWLGDPPREAMEQQQAVYQGYSSEAAQQHWRDTGFIIRSDPAELADELASAMRVSASTTLNLRVHVPGVTVSAARDQIERLGAEVLPLLRAAFGAEPNASRS
jgi:alkanesulfonate monooxygenase SsuD/methylene tetrahydromethanopterin reductase-like flavin-dependent oxidoreductase (luciferase family)